MLEARLMVLERNLLKCLAPAAAIPKHVERSLLQDSNPALIASILSNHGWRLGWDQVPLQKRARTHCLEQISSVVVLDSLEAMVAFVSAVRAHHEIELVKGNGFFPIIAAMVLLSYALVSPWAGLQRLQPGEAQHNSADGLQCQGCAYYRKVQRLLP